MAIIIPIFQLYMDKFSIPFNKKSGVQTVRIRGIGGSYSYNNIGMIRL